MTNDEVRMSNLRRQSAGATVDHNCSSGALSPESNRHRPPRLTRLHQGVRPVYFVTFNTKDHKQILNRDEIHSVFIRFCLMAKDRNVAVGRFVIMPDHIHLFVAMPPNGITLTKWIQSLKSVLGKALLNLGHHKPRWQEGFFDHVLRSGESYGEKWNYVCQNPVRAELVEQARDWPYQGEITRIEF